MNMPILLEIYQNGQKYAHFPIFLEKMAMNVYNVHFANYCYFLHHYASVYICFFLIFCSEFFGNQGQISVQKITYLPLPAMFLVWFIPNGMSDFVWWSNTISLKIIKLFWWGGQLIKTFPYFILKKHKPWIYLHQISQLDDYICRI